MPRRPMMGLTLALAVLLVGASLPAAATTPPDRMAQSMPDLAVLKYWSSGIFAPGNEVSYQICYINQGGYVANDVRIVDTLPEHTTYVSSSQPGFVLIQAGPDQVVWVRDRLSVFERGWLSVTVRVDDDAPAGEYVENTAYILCLDPESNYGNNEPVVGSYVLPNPPDLTVHKELQSGTYGPDHVVSTRIHYRNQGGSATANVRITDTLPAGCTYVSDDNTYGWTTAITGATVVWTHAAVPADSVGDVYVTFRLPADWDPNSDWLENVAEIATADAEANTDNNVTRLVTKPEADRRTGAAVTAVDDRTMHLLSDAGFDYVLYYLDWSDAEPFDNEYNWRLLDAAVWLAWWWNLRLVVRVDRAPAWARGPGTTSAPPSNPAKLGELLQTAAARWPVTTALPNRPQIHGYVVWNEPNLAAQWGGNAPDAAAYTSLLQAAYNGVQAGSPNAWVISAGLATTNGGPDAVDDRTYLQAMYDAGFDAYCDRLGVNPLGFASAPDDTSDPNGYDFSRALDWRAIMVANGDGARSMFATEMGWLRDSDEDLDRMSGYNWIKVSEVDQAHYLARAFHKARAEWVWMGPMMVWNLDLAAFDPVSSERHWFSITDESRDPLRAYYALQNAVAAQGPADIWVAMEPVGAVSADNVQYVIRYTNIGGQTAAGVVLSDTLPAGTAYVSDTGGGSPSGNQVVWNVGDVYTSTYETITLTLRLAGEGLPGGTLT
ncbi:MAG: DUF11 domain-containing protein, partial [Chloroflexi bacterium]|nr:DUF11 domain-containing protein [Chloroflexota bacterium]